MTLRIQKNSDGSLHINNATHLANMTCDICGSMMSNVNVNTQMSYVKNSNNANVGISCTCSTIGGSCASTTCWPLHNGTADAQALALAKTA